MADYLASGALRPAALAVLLMASARAGAAQHAKIDTVPTSASAVLPLTPTRVVRFPITKGTWMSLDVSPDGRMIIFDLLGDLYTLPITGGKAKRITCGMAINRQPRYSPDGRHIVFVSDRGGSENVWIAKREGRHARQLSKLHGYDGYGTVISPAWSPDGSTIVVSQRLGATRPGAGDPTESRRWLMAAYDVATGRMRWISDTTPGRVRSALGPAFYGARDTLYAAVDPSFREVPWRDLANWRIARVSLTTGGIEPEMGVNVGRAGMRPVVSHDGRYLAYATSSGSRVGLRLRDLHTDRERWLVREVLDNPPFEGAESRDLVPGYSFTTDSKFLIVAYGGEIHRINMTGRTTVIPFVAEVERRLGPFTVHQFTIPDSAVRTRSIMQPALSPDGQWVAFSALDRIWVMKLPGRGFPAGKPYRLTADSVGEFYPSWSPNGDWIAYSTWRDGEGGVIRRVRVTPDPSARPSPSQQVTSDTALYFHTAVTPDGEHIVTVRAAVSAERVLRSQRDPAPLNLTLVSMPTGGGQPRSITSLAAVQSRRYPVDQVYFTADPSRIYVGLLSWPWEGTEPPTWRPVIGQEHSGELANEPLDVAGVISPDGQRSLVSRKYTLLELSRPKATASRQDTLELDRALTEPFDAAAGAARRWGTALAPWISWSRDGRRVLFSQGGTLLVGDVQPQRWTTFVQVDVPLMVPVDMPHGTLVLRGACLITMRGNEVIGRGDLVVRDNRILALGSMGQVAIPPDARVIDITGATVIPGYVDVHDHMALAKGIHPQQWWQSLARLAHGVTTARDPEPGFDNDVFTYRERERTGDLLGPRVFSTGGAYYGTDPPIRSLDDARDRVRPHTEYFASETFKVYYDYSTDRRARQLLAMAVAEQKLNATVHTSGTDLALTSVIDGFSGIEHAPKIRIYDDVATLIARSGITYTQTYSGVIFGGLAHMVRHHGWPWEWATMRRLVPPSAWASTCIGCTGETEAGYSPIELDNLIPLVSGASRIVARGGRVGMGGHGNIPGLGFHYELWLHALGGMRNHEILRSATIVGATAIGHAKDFGSLEPGKLADLQILDKNPLEDIHNTTSIRYVMKNGRLYRAEDLTEIWPEYRPLAAMYLWDRDSIADSTRSATHVN